MDVDGRIQVDGRAVDLAPTDARIVGELIARRGGWCRADVLLGAGWPEGCADHRLLEHHLLTINRRLRPLGIRLLAHPERGVALEPDLGWACR
jgi:hypothetical protein